MEELFNTPEIISYGLNLLAYFLIILFKVRIGKTKTAMKVLFEDKVKQVETLRVENVDYAKEVVSLRRALLEILGEEEVTNDTK